ncbi:MAG: valine--tRNA ligase [Anaerolineae bacterium CG_4_9_14_3_um_filter_57_17]|nr:valine--tRNA ligase [bacterium]NCT21203.1 valine--tRNA ligase [bacterium]OIO84236.1 MAG: valine--tRNA ligase [Anaerolineae bacterium CG2_30_57_67]PJB68580.1 MAG: valine--tRNA ligase [Anaerolineae bacterium CG_4_9_14_3_um_filter_57_17]
MTYELPKAYDFKATEERIYAMWEKNGYFQPHNDPNQPNFDPAVKPFAITIPPPNVTGELHLGHAMFVSVEDLMIRYHRMKGYSTLWIPGTDHAGIATQLMVERQLAKEGSSREAIGREAFLERTWQWKAEKGGQITRQIRRLGASCDWTRERFTLDEGLSKAVREAFVTLYEKGLVYRGPRLINWSPGLKTAVSDLEVEYSEEPGTLYYFKYMLADGSGDYIPVATTRPETILGDTAVAVHPEDERYQKFIGKQVIVPMLGREIPVIADDYVTRDFGTGALKITPGHDPNDYEIGQRHNLPVLSMLDKEARVTEIGGAYAGLERFEARRKLWADMKTAGLVIKEEPYTLNVPRSQRGGEIIEPMISEQWFVKIDPLAEKALAAVKNGDTKIVPDYFEKVYYNWMENITDWCISRQLWWGHRIPVWYCADCGKQTCTREDPSACAHCGSANISQDADVLDTWFSSGLWPFSTLGWPDKTPDFNYFYPTSYMETGYDILFFWVARMMMSGLEFTGQAPFHTIYLHGLIRDEHGQKMSKTKGNVIDPLIVMDELGTDALRFTLLVGSTPGKDTNLSLKKVEANRNFANKLWNAARLVITLLEKAPAEAGQPDEKPTLADAFLLTRLNSLLHDSERLFQTFQYGQAGQNIYDFFWNDFADWYLEIAKLQIATGGARAHQTAALLVRVFDSLLRLLHPFTPFVTEEIYGHLKAAVSQHPAHFAPQDGRWAEALIIARWPEAADRPSDETSLREFAIFQEAVRAIRNLRAEKNVKPGQKLAAILVEGEERRGLYEAEKRNLAALAGLDETRLRIVQTLEEKPAGHIALVAGPLTIYLPLAEMSDPAEEHARLTKDLAEAESQIARLEKLLASDFSAKAPAALVQKEREKLAAYQQSAAKLREQLT